MKLRKNSFLFGTFILVATGLLSRVIGFYYRIFLSRTIGATGMGIYQLALPVFSICIAITCSGIHSSISKYVAASLEQHRSRWYLFAGVVISLFLSLCIGIPLFWEADFIANGILNEMRCAPLLRILALCIPLECIHSCINGYYYGLKKAAVPSGCQLIEQIFRVGGVYIMYKILTAQGSTFTELHAAIGLLLGEFAATIFSFNTIAFSFQKNHSFRKQRDHFISSLRKAATELISMAAPLSLNRISLTTLGAMETIFIPQRLIMYGYNNAQALTVYGVFTGMAIPFVFFPTVLSNSVAVLLLPSISKAQKEQKTSYINHAISLCFYLSMLIGFCFTISLFVFGGYIGNMVFHNELAGTFIRTLSWICPFIFLNTTLTSILNGMGQTKLTFGISFTGCLIRLAFVFMILPFYGMQSYLIGLLLSYICTSLISLYQLKKISL